jgi:hypothetical protein
VIENKLDEVYNILRIIIEKTRTKFAREKG